MKNYKVVSLIYDINLLKNKAKTSSRAIHVLMKSNLKTLVIIKKNKYYLKCNFRNYE